MELQKFYLTTLVVGLLTFFSILVVATQAVHAISVKIVTEIRGGNSTFMMPNTGSRAQASCDTNEMVTGGGGIAGTGLQSAYLTESRPIGNGWQVSAVNPSADTVDLYAYAVCAHLEPIP